MKNKIIKGVLFFLNGLTVQYLISFSRGGIDYYKILIIFLVFFIAGYIVQEIEKKMWPNIILFLLSSIGLTAIAFIGNPKAYISWLIEIAIAVPSFFIGFYYFLGSIRQRLAVVGCFVISILLFAFVINPRIKLDTQFSWKKNNQIQGKPISFTFIDEKSSKINIEDFRDKIILLDFWFIGCRPCYLKMKDLEKIASHYKDRNDFVILTVDASRRDTYEAFKKEIKKLPLNLKHSYDSLAYYATQFKVEGFPTELIIDKKGVVREQLIGYNEDIALIYVNKTINKIDKILNEN